MGRRLVTVVAVAAMASGACTGGATPSPSPSTASPSPSISPPARGGEATFGAEQWPECINPITSCASATWTHYAVLQHVLPRAMQLDVRGNVIASPLLAEAPSLENGGLTQDPFTVTYRIAPDAVWDDGSPITSKDFRFTWLAQLNTRGAYAAVDGDDYSAIEDVDTPDSRTVVLRFRDVYVDWPDLFGGLDQYVLKRAAFPDVDRKHPDLSKEIQDEIPFAGGPFRLESWDEDQAVLVRNDRYFGPQALLDRVTMVATISQETEFKDLASGTVSAIFPQPFGEPLEIAFGDQPVIHKVVGDGTYFEALWLNHSMPPLDDRHVREALMYAIDRQAVVDQIVKPWDPNAEVLNCGLVTFPNIGPWCETRPFERFTYDPAMARSILEADGYTCVASPCTKGGKVLEVPFSVVSTNQRRTATQPVIIDRARAAGFSLVPRNYESTGLFVRPFRFAIAEYAQGGEIDPSVTEQFACGDFRNEQNPAGINWTNWCNPAADRLMREADRELDVDRRVELMSLVYDLQALDFVSLPLYILPNVSAWRTDQIAGPIGLWNSLPYGLFFNMEEWWVP